MKNFNVIKHEENKNVKSSDEYRDVYIKHEENHYQIILNKLITKLKKIR